MKSKKYLSLRSSHGQVKSLDSTIKAEMHNDNLQFNILPIKNDPDVTYNISNLCCRCLVRSNNGIIADVSDENEDMFPENAHEFISDIYRGGLWKPQ